MNAEVKEGEILPPTIQRLMKGYNKYLRPFFDSKEAAPVPGARGGGGVVVTNKCTPTHVLATVAP